MINGKEIIEGGNGECLMMSEIGANRIEMSEKRTVRHAIETNVGWNHGQKEGDHYVSLSVFHD